MSPARALDYIASLDKFGIDLGLDRMEACCAALGRPERAVPAIHVAGTNGKGSTCAFLDGVLRATGVRTGVYTSPPLERFGERIRVDGAELADEQVPGLLEAVLDAAPDGMTQFEVITAMAFLHFCRAGVEAAVVEVGLGGRLDATNVLAPSVAVVTTVGVEHADYLGDTPAAVAREKGGVLKAGVPAVTGASGEALEVLDARAGAVGCPLWALGREFEIREEVDGRYRYRGPAWSLGGLEPGLAGAFQAHNLAVAAAALEAAAGCGWPVKPEHVARGVRAARWPGRFEWLGHGPRVVLDGAHNPAASGALARALRRHGGFDRLWLVLGVLGDKDARSILADLLPLAHRVVLTRSSSARAVDGEELADLVMEHGGRRPSAEPDVAAAVDRALAEAGAADAVCVTGSLTVVGEARAHLRRRGWLGSG